MDKMRMESVDMTAKNIDKIGELFPNCITEVMDENGKLKKAINFELLRQMLSDNVVEGDEAYEFTWAGKKASIVEANKPIRKTLRPYKDESVDWDDTENIYIEGDNLKVLKLLQVMTGDARYKRIFGKKKEGVHSMCDVAERLEKMGWEKGQMEGKIEGKILVYKNLRREGFDKKEARRLTELPEDITLEQ